MMRRFALSAVVLATVLVSVNRVGAQALTPRVGVSASVASFNGIGVRDDSIVPKSRPISPSFLIRAYRGNWCLQVERFSFAFEELEEVAEGQIQAAPGFPGPDDFKELPPAASEHLEDLLFGITEFSPAPVLVSMGYTFSPLSGNLMVVPYAGVGRVDWKRTGLIESGLQYRDIEGELEEFSESGFGVLFGLALERPLWSRWPWFQVGMRVSADLAQIVGGDTDVGPGRTTRLSLALFVETALRPVRPREEVARVIWPPSAPMLLVDHSMETSFEGESVLEQENIGVRPGRARPSEGGVLPPFVHHLKTSSGVETRVALRFDGLHENRSLKFTFEGKSLELSTANRPQFSLQPLPDPLPVRRLTRSLEDGEGMYDAPRWSGDGRYLAVLDHMAQRWMAIEVEHPENRQWIGPLAERGGPFDEPTVSHVSGFWRFDWRPEHDRAFVYVRDNRLYIGSLCMQNGQLYGESSSLSSTPELSVPLLDSEGQEYRGLVVEPTWAPDGRRLAITAEGHLLVIDADSLEVLAEVDPEEGARGAPAWSPGGGRLAYQVFPENVLVEPGRERFGVVKVAQLDADGTVLDVFPIELPLEIDQAGPPVWSPDGTRIAFVARRRGRPVDQGGAFTVAVVCMDGSRMAQPILARAMDRTNAHPNISPVFFPDGSRLLFVGINPERREETSLYVAELAGDGPEFYTVTLSPLSIGEITRMDLSPSYASILDTTDVKLALAASNNIYAGTAGGLSELTLVHTTPELLEGVQIDLLTRALVCTFPGYSPAVGDVEEVSQEILCMAPEYPFLPKSERERLVELLVTNANTAVLSSDQYIGWLEDDRFALPDEGIHTLSGAIWEYGVELLGRYTLGLDTFRQDRYRPGLDEKVRQLTPDFLREAVASLKHKWILIYAIEDTGTLLEHCLEGRVRVSEVAEAMGVVVRSNLRRDWLIENLRGRFFRVSLEDLRREGIPESVLNRLEDLEGREVVGRDRLSDILRERLGDEHVREFGASIMQAADVIPVE